MSCEVSAWRSGMSWIYAATEFGDFEEDEFLEFELWKTTSDAMEE